MHRVWPDTNIVLLNMIYRKDKRYTDEQLTDTKTRLKNFCSSCLSILAESTSGSSPAKICPVKPLPAEEM